MTEDEVMDDGGVFGLDAASGAGLTQPAMARR